MKKLLIIAAAILAFASPLGAQMTDEQVVQYVKNAAAEGKSQTQIGKELLAKGVTEAQAERIKAQYEGQLNPDSSSAAGLSSSGQYGPAGFPDASQTVTATCVSQYSVGSVPAAKYSVVTCEPRGSQSHRPAFASFPDFLHILHCTIPSGISKSLFSSPSCSLCITAFQINFG